MSAVKAAGKEIHYSAAIAYVRPMCSGPQMGLSTEVASGSLASSGGRAFASAGGRWIASAAQSHLSKSGSVIGSVLSMARFRAVSLQSVREEEQRAEPLTGRAGIELDKRGIDARCQLVSN